MSSPWSRRPQGAESSGQKVLPTQTERKRVGTAPGGSRADSASAATRAIAHRAPAGRRQPALRSRDAHSPPCRTSGAQSAPYAACWSANHHDSRELTTKRTIGADPLSNRKRVRRPRSAFVDLLLGRARLALRGERGAHPSLPFRRRHRARARQLAWASSGAAARSVTAARGAAASGAAIDAAGGTASGAATAAAGSAPAPAPAPVPTPAPVPAPVPVAPVPSHIPIGGGLDLMAAQEAARQKAAGTRRRVRRRQARRRQARRRRARRRRARDGPDGVCGGARSWRW